MYSTASSGIHSTNDGADLSAQSIPRHSMPADLWRRNSKDTERLSAWLFASWTYESASGRWLRSKCPCVPCVRKLEVFVLRTRDDDAQVAPCPKERPEQPRIFLETYPVSKSAHLSGGHFLSHTHLQRRERGDQEVKDLVRFLRLPKRAHNVRLQRTAVRVQRVRERERRYTHTRTCGS